MNDYNYDKFATDHYDLDDFRGVALGGKAPDFTVSKADGSPARVLDFEANFLVLEMGSITCPLFQSRRGGMTSMTQDFPNADFAILYVREAHPGAKTPSHKTIEDKRQCAQALQVEDGEGRLILVDDMDGTAHAAYGSYPNAVYIINKNGCVVFFSDWNNPAATRRALAQLTAGKPATAKSYFKPAIPPVALSTFRRGGKGSARDFFIGLPKLFWKNMLRRNFLLLIGRTPKIGPDAQC